MGHRTRHHLAITVWAISFGISIAIIGCIGLTSASHHHWHQCMTSLQLHQSEREIELSRGPEDIPARKGVKVISVDDGTSSLLLISLRASVKMWFEHLDLATIVVTQGHLCKRSGSIKGPCIIIRRRLQRPQNIIIIIIIIRSRCCKGVIRIIKRMTRLDSYDHHHRRKGEQDKEGTRHQEQEPNNIDKKTRLTTSTRTSSIIHHICICAISQKHPSRGRGA